MNRLPPRSAQTSLLSMWKKDASGKWTFELEPGDMERFQANDVIMETVSQGCTEEVFQRLACTRCGGPLSLGVHPNEVTYHLHCSTTMAHFGVHGRFAVRLPWHKKHVSFDWLDDT